ncbi:HAMP domain-containing sensor histidine kinase [Ktedonobacter racemifer]|uniref:histidine kinase n=1 Tax=Ktedonobacter racemifer DSM 44963 TaxID=485913 RepID=D6TCW0_KTERA|nr:HAMP domain-containing sensor histidine kinase [Ktedonobacter racemifer]EFH88224.1 integral membrane sensor signal transduction histidine kinase [Ktedonobacter racemifer DSM 44963]
MGTERHTDIKKLFFFYVLSALGIILLLSAYVEGLLVLQLVRVAYDYREDLAWYVSLLQSMLFLAPILISLVTLLVTTVLFGRRLASWYGPPLRELKAAVEKIKRQDLNFAISYNGPDELGDLCRAFNELSNQLQSSLLQEWTREEEAREMVATLSHDLRTPVTILQGHIESLASVRPEKRAQRLERYLPALEEGVQQLNQLLGLMLTAVSLEQSGFTLQPRPIDPEDELARKAESYTLRCAEYGITFHYHVDKLPGLEGRAGLDMQRIGQVLDNLFENALRFTPAGGTISLAWAWNRSVLSFRLGDRGPGINVQDLPHIFDKYYHRSAGEVEREGTPKKSTGLGLYICKELVARHGGSIAARNLPEGGCELSFWVVPFNA